MEPNNREPGRNLNIPADRSRPNSGANRQPSVFIALSLPPPPGLLQESNAQPQMYQLLPLLPVTRYQQGLRPMFNAGGQLQHFRILLLNATRLQVDPAGHQVNGQMIDVHGRSMLHLWDTTRTPVLPDNTNVYANDNNNENPEGLQPIPSLLQMVEPRSDLQSRSTLLSGGNPMLAVLLIYEPDNNGNAFFDDYENARIANYIEYINGNANGHDYARDPNQAQDENQPWTLPVNFKHPGDLSACLCPALPILYLDLYRCSESQDIRMEGLEEICMEL